MDTERVGIFEDYTYEEIKDIIQWRKKVLSHQDLRKFNSFREDNCEHNLDDTIDRRTYKRVIKNNDIKGWEILVEAEYYLGIQPPCCLSLRDAIKYGNYEMFAHILNAYASYKIVYDDDCPIEISELQELVSKNPDSGIKCIINQLIQLLPHDAIDADFAHQHQSEIQDLLGLNDVQIKKPESA
jgi:hypothetical protein